MTVSLTNETAARISEMLSDMQAENDNFDKDPELAAEIDVLLGMLKPQQGKLFTVVYQDDAGDYAEYTVRTADEKTAVALVDSNPELYPIEGLPIAIVNHGNDQVMKPIGFEFPIVVGEFLYFTDPDDGVSSGLYRVFSAPNLKNDEVAAEYDNNTYQECLIKLVNDEGSEIEAHASELRRSHEIE